MAKVLFCIGGTGVGAGGGVEEQALGSVMYWDDQHGSCIEPSAWHLRSVVHQRHWEPGTQEPDEAHEEQSVKVLLEKKNVSEYSGGRG
jgi:hypothetical protein